jgi:hypothetical protein
MNTLEIILTVGGSVFLVVSGVLFYLLDLQKAADSNRRFVIQGYLEKALADRTHVARIPTVQLQRMWKVPVRTLRNPKEFKAKVTGRHPAQGRRK